TAFRHRLIASSPLVAATPLPPPSEAVSRGVGMVQDFYAILGVAPDADAAQITQAFRCLARALHPDTPTAAASSADADSERFTQVVAAWRVLHDPVKRA